ncbi:MAG TPA: 3'(2'),5'-bisphosphate nucleotidase CysQ [Polyangiaceae bacterium]|nr:3'(2'),5'-bisphosphate nucleotidase CysQ [Polyangiaceae bacterium]
MTRADLDAVCAIAQDAGQIIRQIYANEFRVEYKSPGDPVTEADRSANQLICERLLARFPDAAIVAEESPEDAYVGYRSAERVFFVDPLDGTREFVARNGQFVVMIGLLVEHLVTLGAVYAPATGTLWFGERGLGAYRRDSDGSERAIHVGEVAQPSAARITISRSRRSEPLNEALRRIAPRQVTPMGSAGLKGSQVAEAAADAYLAIGAAGKHWDACAMEALVIAAGGCVSDARGEPLDYRAESMEIEHGLLAANPGLHRALLDRLASDA